MFFMNLLACFMIITFCAVCQQQHKSERIFVRLHLIDFDVCNKRMANNSDNDRLLLLNFNYNLLKLADREVAK